MISYIRIVPTTEADTATRTAVQNADAAAVKAIE